MKRIVVFASGTGSNAENIILHFNQSPLAKVVAIFCNNDKAGIIDKAKSHGVHIHLFKQSDLQTENFLTVLQSYSPDLIVLAGFLLKLPGQLVGHFENKIINIHPALLPSYGGRGMYGMNVHNAVLANKDSHSGITIHYVNENYDEGAVIFQKDIAIDNCTTSAQIAEKVQSLEYQWFPYVIEKILNKTST